jgi:hypothetical protein
MSRFWRPNASGEAHALLLKWLYFGSQITFFNNYWPQKSFSLIKFLLNPNLSNINEIGVWHCLVQKLEDASPRICLLFCSRQREDVGSCIFTEVLPVGFQTLWSKQAN